MDLSVVYCSITYVEIHLSFPVFLMKHIGAAV